ncbi:MAG: hypothetical protein DMG97_19325, partial [Acidobacteria bacterium]
MSRAYEGQSECKFRNLSSHVPLFVIGNYHAVDHPQVNVSYLLDHKSHAEDYALATEETAPFVNKWFGDHRERPDLKAEALELPDSVAAP